MPADYPIQRPRSGTLTSALSIVSDAIGEHVDDTGIRTVGRMVGASKSAIHDWSTDLNRWSAAALLILARNVPSIGAAVVALISGREAILPHPTAAISEAYETATRASALIQEIVASVQDGKIDRAEGRRLVQKIENLESILPSLERDVKAAARN